MTQDVFLTSGKLYAAVCVCKCHTNGSSSSRKEQEQQQGMKCSQVKCSAVADTSKQAIDHLARLEVGYASVKYLQCTGNL